MTALKIVLVAALAALALVPPLGAQAPVTPGDRLAGLQWTFVRIRYNS